MKPYIADFARAAATEYIGEITTYPEGSWDMVESDIEELAVIITRHDPTKDMMDERHELRLGYLRRGGQMGILSRANQNLAAALEEIFTQLEDNYDGAPDSHNKWTYDLIELARKTLVENKNPSLEIP